MANDGVHVYNEQLQAHEELLAFARRGEVRAGGCRRGGGARQSGRCRPRLESLPSFRITTRLPRHSARTANGERSLGEARQFLDITQKQELGAKRRMRM